MSRTGRGIIGIVMVEIGTNAKGGNGDGMRCYLAGILFPIIYLTTEPYRSNKFVRFHAFQSILFTVAAAVLTIATNSIRHQMRSGSTLLDGLCLLFFVTWFVLMFKAYRGQLFKLPLLGNLAEQWAG
jgi:uncharacterized membrane protein